MNKCPDKNFIGRCAGCGVIGHRRANCPAKQEEFNRKFERLFNGDSTIKQVDVRKAYLSKKKVGRKWHGGWNNRRRRTRRHRWRTETTCPKDTRFKTEIGKVIGYLNKRDEAESMLDDFGIDEAAFMCKEQGGKFERPSTFLGDTGASTHMVGDDDGMFDCRDINEPVTVGDGKKLIATKIGRLRRTVYHVDGHISPGSDEVDSRGQDW